MFSAKMLIGTLAASDGDAPEGHEDRDPADDDRDARRDQAAEDDDERQARERQAHELAALEIGLGHGLDVPVERGSSGEGDRQPVLGRDGRLEALDRVRRKVGLEIERHDLVDGASVGADLLWGERVGQHTGDVRRVRHGRDRAEHRGLERRVACAGLAGRADRG